MAPDEIMAAHKAQSDGGLGETSLPIRLKLHPEILGELPQEIEPTMESALGIFQLLTDGSDKFEQRLLWIKLAGEIGPHQIEFGSEEWAKMIEKIKGLVVSG